MSLFQVGSIFYIPEESNPFKIKSISGVTVIVSWIENEKEVELDLSFESVNSFFRDGYWIRNIKEERELKLNQIFKSNCGELISK